MTKLYISGKEAVIAAGFTFKLTRENPALTSSGDYTLDVTLPLRGCPQNAAIFGHLNHLDRTHAPATANRYPFTLAADNLQLAGTAVVTTIDQDNIRLQLIAGRSALTLAGTSEADGLDRYIDELDLGRVGEQTWPDGDYEARARALWGTAEETDSVFFPIYSREDEQFSNPLTWHVIINYTPPRARIPGTDSYIAFATNPTASQSEAPQRRFVTSPQPYLVHVIERIITALGFTVGTNTIRTSPFRDLFIANARETRYLHQLLPHWTAREFFREVERFCGVWFETVGTTVNIRARADLAAATPQHITRIIDQYNIEVATDQQQQSTALASIAYKFDDPAPILVLPDEVWEFADVIDVATTDEVPTSAPNNDAAHRTIYHVAATDRYYAFFGSSTAASLPRLPVNHMGKLLRPSSLSSHLHDNTADITLRIVPAALVRKFVDWAVIWQREGQYPSRAYYPSNSGRLVPPSPDDFDHGFDASSRAKEDPSIAYNCLATADTRKVTGYTPYNIQQVIEGGEDNDTDRNKRDIIEVAINGGLTQLPRLYYDRDDFSPYPPGETGPTPYLPLPIAIPYIPLSDYDGGVPYRVHYDTDRDYSAFDLHTPTSAIRRALAADLAYNARATILIDFLDTTPFDPTIPFIIRGRRYLCNRLEYTITDQGISPIRRGYFHELAD